VDDFVQALFCEGHIGSSERDASPRVSFTRGYTQLTMLSANKRVRDLFVLARLLQTKSHRDILCPPFHIDFDKQRDRAKAHLLGALLSSNYDSSLGNHSTNQDNNDDLNCSDTDVLKQSKSDKESGDNKSKAGDARDNLSDQQIKCALDNLDMSYVYHQILPSLDAFTQNV
jgi:hypothetical protein